MLHRNSGAKFTRALLGPRDNSASRPSPGESAGRHSQVANAFAWLALVICSAPATAQSILTLEEAERQALGEEPGRTALLAQADALREQSVVAGQLPDPQLRFGIANFPIEAGGFSTEPMTQGQLSIRQAFPPGKTRALGTQQYEQRATEFSRIADARSRDVRTAVQHAWLDALYWQEAHEIVSDARPYFSDLVAVARSLYGVGRKDQQDVLQAELELSRLDDRLLEINQQQMRAKARLSEWVQGVSSQRVGEGLPSWIQLPALEILIEGLDDHPRLMAADAVIDASDTGISLAEQQYKPGWAIDLGYGYRDGLLANGDSRSDFMSVMVTVDVPLFKANRQDRAVAAARKERRAARETREQLHRELQARLRAEYARWQDLSRQVELYERAILPQADERAKAALTAYQSDASDFDDVVRSQVDALDVRVQQVRLRTERAKSYSVLANLGGLTP